MWILDKDPKEIKTLCYDLCAQTVLRHTHKVNIDALAIEWANWNYEIYEEYSRAKPFSQFLQEKLEVK